MTAPIPGQPPNMQKKEVPARLLTCFSKGRRTCCFLPSSSGGKSELVAISAADFIQTCDFASSIFSCVGGALCLRAESTSEVQRMKTDYDAMRMRDFYKEGDIMNAEVQKVGMNGQAVRCFSSAVALYLFSRLPLFVSHPPSSTLLHPAPPACSSPLHLLSSCSSFHVLSSLHLL